MTLILTWSQVLDSIGVDLGAQLGNAPRTKVPARATPAAAQPEGENDEALIARLAALK